MALQGMGYYPSVIVINANDTVNWTLGGNLVHTISFLSGTPPPGPESPEAAGPAGGPIYNGTGFVSSGILTPGMSYSLNFTKPGTYDYLCILHDDLGMVGKVEVQPVTTPNVTGTPVVTATSRVTRTPGGPPTPIPEFPSVVLPVAAVLGLIGFLLYRRKK